MLTDEERTRLGLKLRALRVERGLRQIDAAKKAKLAVGTLQAIERNHGNVKDRNLDELAKVYGTTVLKILNKVDEPISPTNPLLKGLNEEHLDIAQRYKDARKRVRAAIELLLTRVDDNRLAALILKLETLAPDALTHLEHVLLTAPPDDPIYSLADRIVALSPGDLELLLEYLDQMETKKTAAAPPTTKAAPKSQAAKTKRGKP